MFMSMFILSPLLWFIRKKIDFNVHHAPEVLMYLDRIAFTVFM